MRNVEVLLTQKIVLNNIPSQKYEKTICQPKDLYEVPFMALNTRGLLQLHRLY